jgi:hypothetical protein
MTFKSATSSFVDTLPFNCVTFSSIDPPTFKRATSFFIHAPTLKHLLSSTFSFKHWTPPFKEIVMALRQTKKIRHKDNYALLPFQTLKTLKHVISSYYQIMHMSIKNTRWNLELHQNWCIFEFCPMFFFLWQFLTLCFLRCHVFSMNTWYSPWFFWTLQIILFTIHGIKGKTLCYIFVDSSFVYVWVCKYIFAYLNLKN